MKLCIPEKVLAQHLVMLKAGVLPKYKRDPRKILCVRECARAGCGNEFLVAKKYPMEGFAQHWARRKAAA